MFLLVRRWWNVSSRRSLMFSQDRSKFLSVRNVLTLWRPVSQWRSKTAARFSGMHREVNTSSYHLIKTFARVCMAISIYGDLTSIKSSQVRVGYAVNVVLLQHFVIQNLPPISSHGNICSLCLFFFLLNLSDFEDIFCLTGPVQVCDFLLIKSSWDFGLAIDSFIFNIFSLLVAPLSMFSRIFSILRENFSNYICCSTFCPTIACWY